MRIFSTSLQHLDQGLGKTSGVYGIRQLSLRWSGCRMVVFLSQTAVAGHLYHSAAT